VSPSQKTLKTFRKAMKKPKKWFRLPFLLLIASSVFSRASISIFFFEKTFLIAAMPSHLTNGKELSFKQQHAAKRHTE
jgi:hypothetical protein